MTGNTTADLERENDNLRKRIVELEASTRGKTRENTGQGSFATALHGIDPTYQDATEQSGRSDEVQESAPRQIGSLMKGLAAAGLGVHIVSADYRVVFQNDVLIERFGNVMGEYCYRNYAGLEGPCNWCPMKESLASGCQKRGGIRGADGCYYEIVFAPISTVAGTTDRAIEIVMDITARKRVEEQRDAAYQKLRASELQLRDSNQRLETSNQQLKAAEEKLKESEWLFREAEKSQSNFLNTVMDQSPFAMWISDQNGTVIRTNRSLRNALNLRDEQILNQYNVLEDENLSEQGVMHLVRGVFSEHTPARFNIRWESNKAGNAEFDQGNDLWIDVSIFPIHDAGGNLSHAVCQWIDISEHRAVEERLRRSDVIVAGSTDMLALLDTSYTYLHANQHYANAFGMRQEQLVGKTVAQVLGEEFFARVIRPHAERCMDGEGVRYEDWFDFPATGCRYMQITYARYIGANGGVGGFVVNKRDITDEKLAKDALRQHQADLARTIQERTAALRSRTAELEASNRELESFAYSVSHDLRAPLRAIDGFSRAFIEDYGDRVDGGGRDQLKRVRAGAQRMGMLIDALLQLSRLARVDARSVDVDLSAMARGIVAQLRFNDSARVVDVSIAPGLVAKGDPELLEPALQNLLSNAWKFTSEKEEARIEVDELVIDGERTIYVRDNGAGFDMAYADKLFGVFQRLHDATEFPGTGVGLATVQRLIRKHGGRVWAEGAVDQGATFFFTLPGEDL